MTERQHPGRQRLPTFPAITRIYAHAVATARRPSNSSRRMKPRWRGAQQALLTAAIPISSPRSMVRLPATPMPGPTARGRPTDGRVEDSIYIAPEFHRRGIGKRLAHASDRGKRAARLPADDRGDRRFGADRVDRAASRGRLCAWSARCARSASSTANGSTRRADAACRSAKAIPRRREPKRDCSGSATAIKTALLYGDSSVAMGRNGAEPPTCPTKIFANSSPRSTHFRHCGVSRAPIRAMRSAALPRSRPAWPTARRCCSIASRGMRPGFASSPMR